MAGLEISLFNTRFLRLGWSLAGAASLALQASCATPSTEGTNTRAPTVLQIAGIEIFNGLPYIIHDVTVLVPLSGDYVSCGQILPDTACSTSFPLREYQGNPVQVTWTELGEPQGTPEFSLEAPATATSGQRAFVRVEVFAKGQAGARLVLLDD